MGILVLHLPTTAGPQRQKLPDCPEEMYLHNELSSWALYQQLRGAYHSIEKCHVWYTYDAHRVHVQVIGLENVGITDQIRTWPGLKPY